MHTWCNTITFLIPKLPRYHRNDHFHIWFCFWEPVSQSAGMKNVNATSVFCMRGRTRVSTQRNEEWWIKRWDERCCANQSRSSVCCLDHLPRSSPVSVSVHYPPLTYCHSCSSWHFLHNLPVVSFLIVVCHFRTRQQHVAKVSVQPFINSVRMFDLSVLN